MGYLLSGPDGPGVPPDGQSSLKTASGTAGGAAPCAAPRRAPSPRKEFLQVNMDPEVQYMEIEGQ